MSLCNLLKTGLIAASTMFTLAAAPLTIGAPTGPRIGKSGLVQQELLLTVGGAPCEGSVDLQISMFDDPFAGNQIGETVVLKDVRAHAGRADVSINFGQNCFDGYRRYLDIGVITPASGPKFLRMPTRQEVFQVLLLLKVFLNYFLIVISAD